MSKHFPRILILAMMTFSAAVSAQDTEQSWGQVNEVTAFPPAPAENAVIRVSVTGEKTDSCHNMSVDEVAVKEEQQIDFNIDVEVRDDGAPCSDVPLPFSLAETIDGLPAGDYTLAVNVDGEAAGEPLSFTVSE